MRLVVLEMDCLAAGSVNWGRMVAGMLSQGVTMVVIPDASQHVSAGLPQQIGDGILPRDGVSQLRADNPLVSLEAAFREFGERPVWSWSATTRLRDVERGVGIIHLGKIDAVWHRAVGEGSEAHIFDLGATVLVIPHVSQTRNPQVQEEVKQLQDYLHGQIKPMMMLPPLEWMPRLRLRGWVRCDVLAQQKEADVAELRPIVIDYDCDVLMLKRWRLSGDTNDTGVFVSIA